MSSAMFNKLHALVVSSQLHRLNGDKPYDLAEEKSVYGVRKDSVNVFRSELKRNGDVEQNTFANFNCSSTAY